eukprot:5722407-Pleurochrysis_carterae.AAC.2
MADLGQLRFHIVCKENEVVGKKAGRESNGTDLHMRPSSQFMKSALRSTAEERRLLTFSQSLPFPRVELLPLSRAHSFDNESSALRTEPPPAASSPRARQIKKLLLS